MDTYTETYRGWRIRHRPSRLHFPWIGHPPEYMESDEGTEAYDRLTGETRNDLIQEIDTAIAFFNATGGNICGEMAE